MEIFYVLSAIAIIRVSSSQHINIGLLSTNSEECTQLENETILSHQGEVNNLSLTLHRECAKQDIYAIYAKYCTLLSKNISALLLPSPLLPNVGNTIESYCETHFGLPVIRLYDKSCDWSVGSSSSVFSETWNMILQSVTALSVMQKWSTLVIFHDTDHEKFKTSLAVHFWSNLGITFTTINVDSSDRTLIKKYRPIFLHFPVFLIIANDENVESILHQVRLSNFDLLGQNYEWVILTENPHLHKTLGQSGQLQEGDNVAVLSYEHDMNTTEAITNVLEDLIIAIGSMQKVGEWTDPQLKCGLNKTWESGRQLQLLLQDKNDSQPVCESGAIEVRSLVVDREAGVRFATAATWEEKKGMTATDMIYPDKIRGFNNRAFIVASLEYVPFTRKHPNGTWDGICFEILNELARTLNFSYKVVEPADGKFGIRHPDGNFSGIIGLIQRKEVDFAVNIFSIGADRETVADFTTPFMVDPVVILLQKPDLASSQIFICLGPFSNLVWILIALSVVVVGFILWVITYYHPKSKKTSFSDVGIYDPAIYLWQVFGALMQQGMVHIPLFHSSRVVIASWWFYTIIVVGTYNGNLIAFLTAPKVEMPINTLEDLVSSSMVFGVLRDTAMHGNIMSAKTGNLEMAWDKMKSDPKGVDRYLIDNPNEALRRVLEDRNYAYITEKSFYDTLRVKNVTFAQQSCAFSRAREEILYDMYGFPFQKGSPYVRDFNKGILRILEGGLMDRWMRKWYSGGARCTGLERTTSQKNISLAEAQGAFYILLIGIILALLLLVSEKVAHSAGLVKSIGQIKVKRAAEVANGDVRSNPVRRSIFGSSVQETYGYTDNQPGVVQDKSKESLARRLRNGCCFSVPSSRSTSPQRQSAARNGTIKLHDYPNGSSSHDGDSNGALPVAVVASLKRWQTDIRNSVKSDRETGEHM